MKLYDLAGIAFHNLWSRKLRTAMNLLGVVIACVLLMMTFAGTRGASRGISAIINSSSDVRRIMVYASFDAEGTPPEEALAVEGEMSEKRRARIQERLKQQWLSENSEPQSIDKETLADLAKQEHVLEVVPTISLSTQIEMADDSGELPAGAAWGISPRTERIADRVIAGRPLEIGEDSDKVLISEFAAYRMGYQSDADLERIVGKKLKLIYTISGQRMSLLAELLSGELEQETLADQVQLLLAMKHLVEQVDETDLSDEEKQTIRKALAATRPEGSTPVTVTKTVTIVGVFRDENEDEPYSFLNVVSVNSSVDLYLHHQLATELRVATEDFAGFWGAVVEIDDVAHLKSTVDKLEADGYYTHSAMWIVTSVDREISKAKLAISALALIILLISAIGISNTMIIAVLERTAEFGIMKALGARDWHILVLMLLEGAFTGVVGAAVAALVSGGLSLVLESAVRAHIASRLGESYSGEVFAFSWLDMLMVFAVASTICTLASIFPAWRAARLDPVVAMRKS